MSERIMTVELEGPIHGVYGARVSVHVSEAHFLAGLANQELYPCGITPSAWGTLVMEMERSRIFDLETRVRIRRPTGYLLAALGMGEGEEARDRLAEMLKILLRTTYWFSTGERPLSQHAYSLISSFGIKERGTTIEFNPAFLTQFRRTLRNPD